MWHQEGFKAFEHQDYMWQILLMVLDGWLKKGELVNSSNINSMAQQNRMEPFVLIPILLCAVLHALLGFAIVLGTPDRNNVSSLDRLRGRGQHQEHV